MSPKLTRNTNNEWILVSVEKATHWGVEGATNISKCAKDIKPRKTDNGEKSGWGHDGQNAQARSARHLAMISKARHWGKALPVFESTAHFLALWSKFEPCACIELQTITTVLNDINSKLNNGRTNPVKCGYWMLILCNSSVQQVVEVRQNEGRHALGGVYNKTHRGMMLGDTGRREQLVKALAAGGYRKLFRMEYFATIELAPVVQGLLSQNCLEPSLGEAAEALVSSVHD